MGFTAIKEKASALFNEASFISQIRNKRDYERAMALMDELIEDYDNQKALIDVLSGSIARWENTSPEFNAFNDRIEKLDGGNRDAESHHGATSPGGCRPAGDWQQIAGVQNITRRSPSDARSHRGIESTIWYKSRVVFSGESRPGQLRKALLQ